MSLLLGGIAALTLCFGLLIGTARLFPTPALNPTAFNNLLDHACERPCLLGIEPETTTIVDAMDGLRTHPWVKTVLIGSADFFSSDVTIFWTWNGEQPDFIDGHIPGKLFGWTDDGSTPHVVIGIEFATTLRFYDLEQALGSPTDGLALYLSQFDTIGYIISYPDVDTLTRLNLRAEIDCPFRLMTFWETPAILHYSGGRLLSEAVPLTDLRAYCRAAD
jgi:hypothetical protein